MQDEYDKEHTKITLNKWRGVMENNSEVPIMMLSVDSNGLLDGKSNVGATLHIANDSDINSILTTLKLMVSQLEIQLQIRNN